MLDQPTTPKRWRPRFSVRTLVVLVTLVCRYAACWGPTKTKGVRDVGEAPFGGGEPLAVLRLVIAVDATDVQLFAGGINSPTDYELPHGRRYDFWFFGYVAKREIQPPLTNPAYPGHIY